MFLSAKDCASPRAGKSVQNSAFKERLDRNNQELEKKIESLNTLIVALQKESGASSQLLSDMLQREQNTTETLRWQEVSLNNLTKQVGRLEAENKALREKTAQTQSHLEIAESTMSRAVSNVHSHAALHLSYPDPSLQLPVEPPKAPNGPEGMSFEWNNVKDSPRHVVEISEIKEQLVEMQSQFNFFRTNFFTPEVDKREVADARLLQVQAANTRIEDQLLALHHHVGLELVDAREGYTTKDTREREDRKEKKGYLSFFRSGTSS